MKSHKTGQKESGFALLFAMLALLLLASIGLAMVYAADTETSIDSNYKDQTKASYAAYSALYEAMDRIRQGCSSTSTTCTAIHWPTTIPTPNSAGTNIIYIINPKSGDIVAPWDGNSAHFPDWEICDTNNENFPNSFCSAGAPTSATAYTIYCNGATADCDASAGSGNYNKSALTVNAPWTRSVPFDYKWIRINLKTEQMLPGYPVNSSTTTNGVVCWDGHGELSPGTGYNSDCTPNGGLTVAMLTPGGGWTSTPTVTLGSPDIGGGTQATVSVNATQTPNAITTATVTTAGSGYTSNPTVTLSDTTKGGSVTAHAVPVGAALSSIAIASGGSGSASSPCFTGTASTPTVSITGGSGSGATASATMSGATCIAGVSVSGSCNGNNYKSVTYTGVTVTGGTGSGAVLQIVFNGSGTVSGSSMTTAGTGYTSTTGLALSKTTGSPGGLGNSCQPNLTATFTLGQQLSSLTLLNGGSGYRGTPTTPSNCTSGCPSISFSPTPTVGSAPTASYVVGAPVANAGQIDYLTIVSPGAGFTVAPTLTFSGGGGTGAVGVTTISNNPVTVNSITVGGGTGYSTVPTCTISGGGLASPQDCTSGAANGMTLSISAGQSIYYGQVAQITAFSQTSNFGARMGAKSTTQMEIATSVRLPAKFNIGGAITLAGPSVYYNPPNSNPYIVNGTDAGSCGNGSAKPAIGVIDDPSNPQGLAAQVVADIPSGRNGNYTGAGAAPDVENAFSALGGSPTPASLDALLQVLKSETQSGNLYQSPGGGVYNTYTSLNTLTPTGNPPINFVDGNLSMSGNFTGSGILVVTGTLTFSGNYTWNGLVLAIGQGVADMQGGGNGQITGSLYVAKIYDTDGSMLSQLGTSSLSNSGGGGNGVQYNSCYADSYLSQLPKIAADPLTIPGKVLSIRTVTKH